MATVIDAVDADTVRVTFARSIGSVPTAPSVEVTVIGVERPEPGKCVVAVDHHQTDHHQAADDHHCSPRR